jgi:uncharacterized protein
MAAKKKAKKSAPAKKAAKKKAPAKKPAPKKAAARKAPAKKKGPAIFEVVHWEIQSQMPDRLHDFYRDALGWNVDANNPMNYGMVSSGGKDGINGGIGGSDGAPGSRVVVYATVPDINAALARIEEHGGRTVVPRIDIGVVIMAQYVDPEGNRMGLLEA